MKKSKIDVSSGMFLLKSASCLVMIAAGMQAHASEGFRSRQSTNGGFGGEMAAQAENPGLFGTIGVSRGRAYQVADDNGNKASTPAANVPLPTGAVTGGAIPNGTYTLNVPSGNIEFNQDQSQINLVGGYLTDANYNGGRLAFSVNLPLIKQSRSFIVTPPVGTLAPVPPLPAGAQLRAAVNGVAAAANAQAQAQALALATSPAIQNTDASGLGDAELAMNWIHHQNRTKVTAGVSLFVPTGSYDKTRGPNPGFGNFYTLRTTVSLTHALNPNQAEAGWDTGVTVAGRMSLGVNTTNRDTDYRSGSFVYMEAGVTKVIGNWAFGSNLLAMQQLTYDTGTGAPANGNRYRNAAYGPFLAYKLPGQEAGFNLQYSDNFASRNAQVVRSLQLRFTRLW